jgi:signal peptidase II
LNWKKYLTDYAWLLGGALIVVLLDQSTKAWVRNTLTYGEIYRPDLWLTKYVRIMHWGNTGGAGGIMQGRGEIFMIISFIVAVAVLYFFPQTPRQERLLRLALILQFGGAAGNLIDRLHLGYVVDFISIGTLPVLNLADASLIIGIAVLLVGTWLRQRQEKAQPEATETPG